MKRLLLAIPLVLGLTSCDVRNPFAPGTSQLIPAESGKFYVYVEVDGRDDAIVRHPYYLDARGEEIDTSLFIEQEGAWTRILLAFDRHDPGELNGAYRVSSTLRDVQSGLPPVVLYNIPAGFATLDGVPLDLYVKFGKQYVKASLEVVTHHPDPRDASPSPSASGLQGGVLSIQNPTPTGGGIKGE